MRELLRELCLADGVTSNEDEIRALIHSKAEKFADECYEDALGNFMVFKKGKKSGGGTVMLCAHMDEVGLMVTSVTDDGYLKFAPVGGIDPRVLVGKRVKCGEGKVPGVIGFKPVHLVQRAGPLKPPKADELYIDVGANDKAGAEKSAGPGDICSFDSDFIEFGSFVKCKAIDDRLGCAVMLTLLSEEFPVDAWFAFTAQEEAGTRGAMTAAYSVKPDIALIIEGTTAADLPETDAHKRVCAPGKGVVIPFMDNGSVAHPELYSMLTGLCEKNGIPWQTKEYVSGGTDAAAIQRSRAGVKTIGIAAATRYIHSPSCVVSAEDCDNLLKLARVFLNEVGGIV